MGKAWWGWKILPLPTLGRQKKLADLRLFVIPLLGTDLGGQSGPASYSYSPHLEVMRWYKLVPDFTGRRVAGPRAEQNAALPICRDSVSQCPMLASWSVSVWDFVLHCSWEFTAKNNEIGSGEMLWNFQETNIITHQIKKKRIGSTKRRQIPTMRWIKLTHRIVLFAGDIHKKSIKSKETGILQWVRYLPCIWLSWIWSQEPYMVLWVPVGSNPWVQSLG